MPGFDDVDVVFPDDKDVDDELAAQERWIKDTSFTDIDAEEAEAEEEKPELTYEERLDKLEQAVLRQALHREILYKTLQFCLERHELREVEDMIAALPQFQRATLSQYHLIQVLVKYDGLTELMMNDEDQVVAPEMLEGLTEDEADDLVAYYAYETTDIGTELVEDNTPKNRIEELFMREPTRVATYREVLEFCAEKPRTYNEVQSLLDGRDALIRILEDGSEETMQPSVFVDKLERSGGLAFDGGWVTTKDGKEFMREN